MLSITYVWWVSSSILWYVSHPCCFSPVLRDPPAAWLQDSALSIASLWLCFFSGAGSDLSTLRQTKQGTEQAIGGASFLRVGCGVICLHGECLGTGSGFKKYDLCLKTFFSEIKKNASENVAGCFLIQSAEFLSDSNSSCSSFELMVQLWAAVLCNEKQRRICPVIPLLFATFSHLHIDGRALGISKHVFLKLIKEKEFHMQFLLRFLAS